MPYIGTDPFYKWFEPKHREQFIEMCAKGERLQFTMVETLMREAFEAALKTGVAAKICCCEYGGKWQLLHEIIPCEPLNYCSNCGGKLSAVR